MGSKKVISLENKAKALKTRNQSDIIDERRKNRKKKIKSALTKRNK